MRERLEKTVPISLLVSALTFVAIRAGGDGLHGSDPFMHLVHVTGPEPLGDGWLERLNAPEGTVVPWTEPFDLILIAAGLVTQFLTGQPWSDALETGAFYVAPIGLGTVAGGIYWGLSPFTAVPGRLIASIAATGSPLVINYGRGGMADHHVFVLAFGVIAVAGIVHMAATARYTQRAAAPVTGLAGALGIWMSVECLLVILPAWVAFVLWRVVMMPSSAPVDRPPIIAATVQALVVSAGLVVDPPQTGHTAVVLDRLSVFYVVMAWLIVATLLGVRQFVAPHDPLRYRLADTLMVGGLAAIVWIMLDPAIVTGGPMAHLDPRIENWHAAIGERQTLWSDKRALAAAAAYVPGVVAMIGLPFMTNRARSAWLCVLAAALPAFVLGTAQTRAAYYPAVVLMVAYGIAADAILRHLKSRLTQLPAMAAFCALPFALTLASIWFVLNDRTGKSEASLSPVAETIPAANGPGRAVVLGPLDAAPELLWLRSDLAYVGGNYHRSANGIVDTVEFMNATDAADARRIADKRNVAYVVVDTGTSVDTETIRGRLADRRRVPEWLTVVDSVELDARSFRVYEMTGT